MTQAAHEVGKSADAGYQIGVRRTLPYPERAIWDALLSPAGRTIWLGGPAKIEPGEAYELDDGTTGEVRVFTPGSHIRLTWQPRGWERASTVQVRVIPAKTGTTLSFHQEWLDGQVRRQQMKARWEGVIDRLAEHLGAHAV